MKEATLPMAALLLVLAATAHAEFIQNPHDSLAADTVDMVFSVLPCAATNQLKVQMDLYVFNDGNNYAAVGMGFSWDNPNLQMDSAVVSPFADSGFNYFTHLFYNVGIDLTNANQKFIFGGVASNNVGLEPSPIRQLWASYHFTLSEWSVDDSIVVDTMTFSIGSSYQFWACGLADLYPFWTGLKVVHDTASCCCINLTGNVDGDPDDICDISDLTFLNNFLFSGGPPPPCMAEANIDGDPGGIIDIGDMTALIDYLFITYTPPAPCQ